MPVHPRSRGEHSTRAGSAVTQPGSSPLARGTHHRRRRRHHVRRFIPARAGNTHGARRRMRGRPVHPRSRGEHAPVWRTAGGLDGSSPLARGTHGHTSISPLPKRFIPARAGNTGGRMGAGRGTAVHPRSRGEHDQSVSLPRTASGSSPLARGTRAPGPDRGHQHRFIPARAGNTEPLHHRHRDRSVHPRSRGEHPVAARRHEAENGSSPLARGTRRCGPPRRGTCRFIPARAGNTGCSPPRPCAPPVHPRSRGEHA